MAAIPANHLKVREVYRYPKGQRVAEPTIDSLRNFYAVTDSSGLKPARMERGITGLPVVRRADSLVRPAILIRSSPHKAGSAGTPWDDYFDIDRGHVRYFGDNRPSLAGLAHTPVGNASLLEQFELHNSGAHDSRAVAAPILLFRGVSADGRLKGQVEFAGVALVERAELITQVDPVSGATFPNYRFDLLVLDLSAEGDTLDWAWIDARRRPGGDIKETLMLAPASWRRWVADGPAALDKVRRRVIGMRIVPKADQLPVPGTPDADALDRIYRHYKKASGGLGEHGFEAVAERVAQAVLERSGRYRLGWITRKSGDFGIDFVGRLDVGEGFATAKLVVLGQAKCEQPNEPTSAQDVARTVARLRRGWLGVYVTTSHFSTRAQREFAEDAYPLVLVNGRQVAEVAQGLALIDGYRDIDQWLDRVDAGYADRLRIRSPEEILVED
jgi:hypothetical protein